MKKKKKNKNKHKHFTPTIKKQNEIAKNNFKNLIIKNKDTLPKTFDISENINSYSWFDITNTKSLTDHNYIKFKKDKVEKEIIKCIKYDMILTTEHKKILNKWFEASTKMYNETLKFIKTNFNFTKNDITNSTVKVQDKKYIYELEELEKMYNSEYIFNSNYNHYINKKIKRITDKVNDNKSLEDTLEKFKLNNTDYCNDIYLKKQLKTIKNKLIDETKINNDKNTCIYSHILDESISQLASNIKSARTNLYRGNIKKFRLKYWKHNRPSQTLEIEKLIIKNNEVCPLRLNTNDKIRYSYNGKECVPNITSGVKINYNRILNKYTLLVPIKETPYRCDNKSKNLISLDPGLRTFMTGISENESVKIGNNVNKIIEKDIKRINKIKDNERIPKKTKKKNEKTINRKIKNKVDDLHWKTANYLVNNYECILLGDMSAKGIVSKNSSILSNTQKVACLRTNYYVFSQRLAFKCKERDVTFKLVDERYTSQTCSCCGNINKDLGGSNIYNCKECKTIIDRDINGARNIYIKSLLSKTK